MRPQLVSCGNLSPFAHATLLDSPSDQTEACRSLWRVTLRSAKNMSRLLLNEPQDVVG